jgi:hypothetical protein
MHFQTHITSQDVKIDTCPKLSESKTVFNIFGSKIREWWDRDQLLEDQVEPLIFVANTDESSKSSSEFDSDDD